MTDSAAVVACRVCSACGISLLTLETPHCFRRLMQQHGNSCISLHQSESLWNKEHFKNKRKVNDNGLQIFFMFKKHLCSFVFQTSFTLTWASYLLARHPHVQQQIFTEVSKTLGPGTVASAQDVHRLPLIRGLVKETLRCALHGGHCPASSSLLLFILYSIISQCWRQISN